MGSSVRDKHVRANRKIRSAKSEPDHANSAEGGAEVENPVSESGVVSQLESGLEVGDGKSVVGANPNPNLDENGLGKCTEGELEEVMLRNLECLYREAIVTLTRLGYKEEVALRAVLKNGYCYGSMDVMSNVVHNALMYLNGGCKCSDDDDDEEEEEEEEEEDCEVDFVNLRMLAEYSLGEMVFMLKEIRPEMSKADALWCLLMGDVNVGRAPPKKPGSGESDELEGNERNGEDGGSDKGIEGESGATTEVGIPPGLCKFHGGWGFGEGKSPGIPGMANKVQCPKRFDLPPPLKEMLNKNISPPNSTKLRGDSVKVGVSEAHSMVSSSGLKLDVVISMLNKLHEMKLDEKKENTVEVECQKEEMIANLVQQIKDLEKQVEERREWARAKAMQAARKLSSDLTELKILRMEREEETQRIKKGKQNLEDPTKKRFAEMESALRKASGQVDRANAAVRRLENENAEMRAEMEAAKLNASENVKTCMEIAKREKKSVKRLLALEKQKTKLQEEIMAEKKRITDVRQEIIQVEQAQKVTEAKWKQEIEAKDQALAQLEELRRTKEAIEAENKRRHEALRLKIEIDFQGHKDDLQRLEQELARLKLSANPASSPSTKNSDRSNPQEDTIARMLNDLDLMDDSSETEEHMNRECILCMKDEVSVVFLPCAHQVICASCNETYGKKGKPTCPCCRTPIQQRICVFGASS